MSGLFTPPLPPGPQPHTHTHTHTAYQILLYELDILSKQTSLFLFLFFTIFAYSLLAKSVSAKFRRGKSPATYTWATYMSGAMSGAHKTACHIYTWYEHRSSCRTHYNSTQNFRILQDFMKVCSGEWISIYMAYI